MAEPTTHLERYRLLARSLDSRFGIPGTPIRFGWDAVLGLIPGIGDALGGIIGSYGLFVATRLGTPPAVLIRMLINLLLDLALGVVPVAGDLFDVVWRGNLRNLALLERWLAQPHAVRRSSNLMLWGLCGFVAGIAGLAIWLGVKLAIWLLSPFL